MAYLFRSTPIDFLFGKSLSNNTVPTPQNGSSIVSFSLVAILINQWAKAVLFFQHKQILNETNCPNFAE